MFHDDTENIGKGNFYGSGWRGIETPTAGELKNVVLKYASSPCLWNGGIRLKKNFKLAEWMGLDFDSGLSLLEATKIFDPYLHLIGTTKSHGIVKDGVTQDRFRVFLKFDRRVTSIGDYEQTVKKIVEKYGADKACVDGARFFWPLKEIVSMKYYGSLVEVVDSKEIYDKYREFEKKRKADWEIKYKPGKTIPWRVKHKLDFGVPEGTRNTSCFQIAADLNEVGFCFKEIVDIIMGSEVPIDTTDKTQKEIEKAVRSGISK